MSILIKGVEMPNPGHIVLVEIDENGDVFAAYDGGRTKLTQHKAIPVPPHGDLIERNAAHDSILDGMVMTGYQSRALDCISEFYVPTIIPAEEGGA